MMKPQICRITPLARPLLMASLLLSLLLCACSDKGTEPVAAAKPVAETLQKVATAQKPATETVVPDTLAPEISLALRGIGDERMEQGEPLRVVLRLRAPGDGNEVFELTPTSGSWCDALSVELVPSDGGPAVARGEVVGQPASPKATLNAKLIAGGLWYFPATALQSVPPGQYLLRARLAIQNSGGWNGEVVSEEIPLEVVAVSANPYRVSQRTLNLAQAELLGGRNQEAATLIDSQLAKAPDDIRLLMLRAQIAERAGNPVAALLCLRRVQRLQPVSAGGQPDIDQQELEVKARAALAEGKLYTESPPAWTWPPTSVIKVSDEELLAMAKTGALPQGTATAAKTVAPQPVAAPALVPTQATKLAAAATPPAASPITAAVPAKVVAKAGGTESGKVVPAAQFNDTQVLATTTGQWAVSATAGSQYDRVSYSAAQAVGAPNVPIVGNSPAAWCPAKQSEGSDWLEVSFAQAVHATEVRVRQNDNVGAINKIEALEADGTVHLWWEGVDPFVPAGRDIVWFVVRVTKTPYLVARIKITLNLALSPGWKEIDAVQLVGGKD